VQLIGNNLDLDRMKNNSRRQLLCFTLAASLLGASLEAIAATSIDPQQAARIDADVQTVMQRADVAGATIAIIEKGQIVYTRAYGLRERERKLPARTDTHYEIGSITKQFTAAAIMQLQEAGKLSIDATLATYLPDAPHAREVTLRQMLSHTSGLPEYLDGPNVDEEATHPATYAQLMARIDGKPLDFAPGSKWSYCNTGYFLLGRIIEVVSHEPYYHYVRKHLLDPAGMKQTFTVADEAKLAGMAVGYWHEHGKTERAPAIDDTWGWSAGGLVSTIADLQKWNQALTGGRIVSKASYALMTTPVTTAQGNSEYGFGLFVDSVEGQPRIGHTGGSNGFTTANEYFPKQDLRIIAFTNDKQNPEPGEIITTAIFNDLYPAIAAEAMRPAAGEDAAVTATAKATFAEVQSGKGEFPQLTARLAAKMKAGLAEHNAKNFSPYGAPTAFTFKGRRADAGLRWFDYLIQFGPGSLLKFGIGLDDSGKIASFSFG
jgi:CubicO group peptidase (beta-lactamase class C family)